MTASGDLALVSSIVTQIDELAARITILAEQYGTTPDSAVASELFAAERALATVRRALDRAAGLLQQASDI